MDWIKREVTEGFKRLMCLGLERTPAAEVITLTAAVWLEALAEGRQWEQELDAPRFRRGFATLCRSRRAWPVPQDLLDALPPREQLQIARESRKADPERAAAAMAEVESLLTHGKGAAAGGE